MYNQQIIFDAIQLENAIFTKLATTGVLNAGMFIKAAAAQDFNDYLMGISINSILKNSYL